ncbi:hypothetical protein WDZ92_39210, partial [Nostoc sp. NIES-2111]
MRYLGLLFASCLLLSAQEVFPAASPEAEKLAPLFPDPLPPHEATMRSRLLPLPPPLSLRLQYSSPLVHTAAPLPFSPTPHVHLLPP